LTTDATLPVAGLPWVLNSGPGCEADNALRDYEQSLQTACGTGLTVASTATLTLQPGEVLKADSGGVDSEFERTYTPPAISVEGALSALGTAAKPIYLTSLYDQSVGGSIDSSTDDGGLGPDDWGQLSGDNIHILHTVLDYGDGVVTDDSDVISNDLLDNSGAGIEADGGTIEHNLIENSGYGIKATVGPGSGPSAPSDPLIEDNAIDDNAGPAMEISGSEIVPAGLSGNTGSGDKPTAIVATGVLSGDLALPTAGLAWAIGAGNVGGCPGPCTSGLEVETGATLTLNAGAVLKTMSVPDDPSYSGGLVVEGSLVAHGTVTKSVAITSGRNDSVGGDLNGDGTATSPKAGDWFGITTYQPAGDPAPTVDLEHTNVSFEDIGVSIAPAASRVTLTNDKFTQNVEAGISAAVASGGGIDIENDTVTGGEFVGIEDYGPMSQGGTKTTIANNTVTGVTGPAILLNSTDIDPADVSNNSGSGNTINAIEADGVLTHNLTLPASGLPWVVGDLGNNATLEVAPNATLRLNPGTVLKFQRASLWVQGTLTATGTSSSPVTLTSLEDDSVGGDTNGDGSTSSPSDTDWDGVSAVQASGSPTPTITMNNTTIEYASTALSDAVGSATITGTIENDQFGVVGPDPAADSSCPTGTVTATPVDWGTITGPAPNGTGPGVSGCVNYQPWVGEP
jgi:hypothetical protein